MSTDNNGNLPNDDVFPLQQIEAKNSHEKSSNLATPVSIILNSSNLPKMKTARTVKSVKRTWDTDKALRSTYQGVFGKYQLRTYVFLAFGYGLIAAWLTEMPTFALLTPNFVDCSPKSNNQSSLNFSENSTSVEQRKSDSKFNHSDDYGVTVLTEFEHFCDEKYIKIPHIIFLIGLIIGGLVFGYAADHSGRKMVLLGSMWTTCVLSIFQLLSGDYISYAFFMVFLGISIGAVQVIAIPFVMEMFPIRSRPIYGLGLLGIVYLLDLVIPWLAFAVRHWKFLQAIVTIPLIVTAALYWFSEESMFWFTAQKDYQAAIHSLIKIAQFNGVDFENRFREARNFLRGKFSKGVQCDFQPLLRLTDINEFITKYPDFDVVDFQTMTNKKSSLGQRIHSIVKGHHFYPSLSTFYPTDYLHSSVLMIYLLVMSGLWLVSSLVEYSFDSSHFTRHLTGNAHEDYFYSHLIQIVSLIVVFPLVHFWGRRWPTFCFFLIAEVSLLASVAVKLDQEETRAGILVVYFIGKFASRAAFLTIFIYTCEIFPTGLRCTSVGICFTFRTIGILLASPTAGEINDWTARLVYGILSLILGSLVLLLPESKSFPLARTFGQIESFPSGVSSKFRQRRSFNKEKEIVRDETFQQQQQEENFSNSRLNRVPTYDVQSTLHSIYELEEFGQDETIHSLTNRIFPRGIDVRTFLQPTTNGEFVRNSPIAEDVERDDDEEKRSRQLRPAENFSQKNESTTVESFSNVKQKNVDETNVSEQVLSQSPRYRRTMSQDENYFSEHS